MSALIYIGNGAAIIGVPARDLTEEEVKELGWLLTEEDLLKSNLYKKAEIEPAPKKMKAQKEGE